eukprot:TRINITY_DN830_c0_g1_i1.p1 TRINITY_DN830_c0_g1~~TRINITY_DN830_c0_g1_i1.p1  ORF type:complete len:116 (-),score=7.63 TRINITY_DN830_c0_g1_i1:287-583(-)
MTYPCRRKKTCRVQSNGTLLKENMCFRFGESSRSYVLRGTMSMVDGKNPNFGPKETGPSKKLDRDFCILDQISSKNKPTTKRRKKIKNTFYDERPKVL